MLTVQKKAVAMILALLLTFLFILSACATKKEEPAGNGQAYTHKPTDLSLQLGQAGEFQTEEFILGSKDYKRTNGTSFSYPIRGMISLPKGGGAAAPLVLIIHGSYNNEDENLRFDKGFSYLTEALASHGFAAASLDLQKAYLWKYGENDDNQKIRTMVPVFLERLKEVYGEQINFEEIYLIGHSRGGDTIFDLALDIPKVKGLLSVAPALSTTEREWVSLPTSILVGELDGDVVDWAGYQIFDILSSKNPGMSLSFVLLQKANHNFFNSSLTKNDGEMTGKDLEGQLTPKQQQEFLADFACDFLTTIQQGKAEGSLLDHSLAEPKTMYGLPVKCRFTGETVDTELTATSIRLAGAEATDVIESAFYQEDQTKGFLLPLPGDERYNKASLVSVTWQQENSSVSYQPADGDFGAYSALLLNLAIDTPNELNIPDKNQSFSVILTDEAGISSKVTLGGDTPALDYVEGSMDYTEIFDDVHYFWTSYTPIVSVRIPLQEFGALDFSKINSITLSFDQNGQGALMISDIRLLR